MLFRSHLVHNAWGRVAQENVDATAQSPAAQFRYQYDEAGHLLVMSDVVAGTRHEYFYLKNEPVGYLMAATASNTNVGLNAMHTDHLGQPQLTTNSSQAVITQFGYTPFGQRSFGSLAPITVVQGFPGQFV